MTAERRFEEVPARTGYDPRRPGAFWDRSARDDVLVAIFDTPEVRAAGGIEAFARSGEETTAELAAFLHPESVVVDLGCGIGRVLRGVARRCRVALGVDVSGEMLAQARRFLAGAGNVGLVQTDGRTLAAVADGAVDFLYSLLCLIHVDRRTAFGYFAEVRRVLARDGCALLQFHDIASEPGLAKFRSVIGSDYPLEFYTEGELRLLLAAQGLSVVGVSRHVEYLVLTVVAGDASAWLARYARDVRVTRVTRSGGAAPGRLDLRHRASLSVAIAAAEGTRRTCRLRVDLRVPGGTEPLLEASAAVPLRAGAETEVHLDFEPDARFVIRTGSEPLLTSTVRVPATPARAVLNAALLPADLDWPAAAAFRDAALSEEVEVRG